MAVLKAVASNQGGGGGGGGPFVPYTGATGNVNLGANNITANGVTMGLITNTGGDTFHGLGINAGGIDNQADVNLNDSSGNVQFSFGAVPGQFYISDGVANQFFTIDGSGNIQLIPELGSLLSMGTLSGTPVNVDADGNMTVQAFTRLSGGADMGTSELGWGTGDWQMYEDGGGNLTINPGPGVGLVNINNAINVAGNIYLPGFSSALIAADGSGIYLNSIDASEGNFSFLNDGDGLVYNGNTMFDQNGVYAPNNIIYIGNGAGSESISQSTGDMTISTSFNLSLAAASITFGGALTNLPDSSGNTGSGSAPFITSNGSGGTQWVSALGIGLPQSAGNSIQNNKTAALTSTSLVSSPAGVYQILWTANIRTAATVSSVLGGTNGFQVSFKDSNNNVTKTSSSLNGITSNQNTTATTISGSLLVWAHSGTAITYTFDYTSSGATAMAYDLYVQAIRID